MKELALSLKITALTVAFVAVMFGIYHLKTRGMSPTAQRALGVHPEGAPIKAKVIMKTGKTPEAVSQNPSSEAKN